MASKNLCDSLHILQMHGSSLFCFSTGFAMSSLLEFHQNTWCTKEFPRWFRVSPDTTSSIHLCVKTKNASRRFLQESMCNVDLSPCTLIILQMPLQTYFNFWYKGNLIERDLIWFVSIFICSILHLHLFQRQQAACFTLGFHAPAAKYTRIPKSKRLTWLQCWN